MLNISPGAGKWHEHLRLLGNACLAWHAIFCLDSKWRNSLQHPGNRGCFFVGPKMKRDQEEQE
jgi:hypothetical protein